MSAIYGLTTNATSAESKPGTDSKVFLFLAFIMFAQMFVFLSHIPSMDEIWNYQFARRILYGYIPYKDYFMLTTPLSAQINSLFLYLFSDELIVLRILGFLAALCNSLALLSISHLLGGSRFSLFLLLSFFTLLLSFFPENNYSWYSLLFITSALYLELNKIKKPGKIKRHLLIELTIGALLGLATMTKQNIGCLCLLASSVYNVYQLRDAYTRNAAVKGFLAKLAGWFFIVGVELFYLVKKGALPAFLDQTVISTQRFMHAVMEHNTISGYLSVSVLMLLLFLLLIKGYLNNNSPQLITALYSLANLSFAFPISDPIHIAFAIGLPIVFVSFFEFNSSRKIFKTAVSAVVLASLLYLISPSIKSLDMINQEGINHFTKIPIPTSSVQDIKEVDNFILRVEKSDKLVYLLDYRAAFYLITLDKFAYKYDCMLIGNFGSHGEEELRDRLTSPTAVVLLGNDNLPRNKFENPFFRQFVKENMLLIDRLNNYDVYANH